MKRFTAILTALLLCAFSLPAHAATTGKPQMNNVFEGMARIHEQTADGIKYGYADASGKTVIPCRFDDAYPFKGGVACVKLGGGWGFVDRSGDFVVQPKYSSINITGLGGIDSLPYSPSNIVYFENGPLLVIAPDGQRYGLLARDGTELLAPVFSSVSRTTHGFFQVTDGNNAFVIDENGTQVGPSGYSAVYATNVSDIWIVGNGRLYALAADSGELISTMEYEGISSFSALAFTAKKDGKWGFVGADGTLPSEHLYDWITVHSGGAFTAWSGDHSAIVDALGQPLTPFEFNSLSYNPYSNTFTARKGDKLGAFKPDGTVIFPAEYDEITTSLDHSFIVRKDGKAGIFSVDGTEIVAVKYEDAVGPVNGVAAVKDGGKWYLLQKSGATIALPYDRVAEAGSGLFVVMISGIGAGCVDTGGNLVIPVEYSSIRFNSDVAIVNRLGGRAGCIAPDGSIVFPFEYDYFVGFDENGQSAANNRGEISYLTRPADTPSTWARDAVESALSNWLIPAELQNSYRKNITRQEFCALVANDLRMREVKSRGIAASFEDTDDADILFLAQLGIVQGVGGDLFDPEGRITREQAAILLTKYMEFLGVADIDGASDYTDRGSISGWALSQVDFVSRYAVMTGIGGGRFDPKGFYTREQAVITLVRIFDMTKPER